MTYKADGLFDCGWCGQRCHDIIEEWKGRWKVECCYCGLVQTEFRVEGVIPRAEKAFVFPAGRLRGMTIEEAAETPRGLRIIEWSAENEELPEVREACLSWLDTQKIAR
jgi:hypothetical protein